MILNTLGVIFSLLATIINAYNQNIDAAIGWACCLILWIVIINKERRDN